MKPEDQLFTDFSLFCSESLPAHSKLLFSARKIIVEWLWEKLQDSYDKGFITGLHAGADGKYLETAKPINLDELRELVEANSQTPVIES